MKLFWKGAALGGFIIVAVALAILTLYITGVDFR